jgi:hypothetical protein
MPSLAETQAALAAALLGRPDVDVAALVAGDGVPPAGRVAIHRHHFVSSLTAALRVTYPVVHRLVGDGFFRYAARAFIAACPPRDPRLAAYGAALGDFLEAFPPCRALAYLGDVARLEWAIDRAWHADEAVPLAVAALRSVDPSGLAGLTVRFDPSIALLASAWPVDAIWRANRDGAPAGRIVDAGEGPVALEVRRLGDDVVFRRLAPAAHAFRRALMDGRALAAAAAAAQAVDPALDLTAALHELFTDNVLIGFRARSRTEDKS